MHDDQTNLFLRNDTIFGVCQGLGEDFGFNPTYLRIVFASLVYFSPAAVIGTYVGLGFAVALSRWLFPVARPAAAPQLACADAAPVEAAVPAGHPALHEPANAEREREPIAA